MNLNKNLLTTGPIRQTLLHLTLPMMMGMIGMVIFNIIDTYFIGKLGTIQLTAMSYTLPVIMIVGSIAMGISVSITAVVSLAIGEENTYKVQRLTTDGIFLSLLLVGIISLFGYISIYPLFLLLGATSEVMPFIDQYMSIWYFGTITIVIPMVGNSAIRATGDTKTPAKIMLVAVIINIILDPIFIFGLGPIPNMGITGAAIATVISRSITLFVSMWMLIRKVKIISFILPSIKQLITSWKIILHIGLPAIATGMIIPFSTGIITKMISVFGNSAVAAFGIASRIESVALIFLMALGSVLSPFVGQNIGSKKYDRVKQGIKYSHLFSIIWGICIAILLAIFGRNIGKYFDSSTEVIKIVSIYFLIRPISFGFQGIFKQVTTIFNVLKKPINSSLIIIFQMFVLYIPLSFLGAEIFGLYGIFFAMSTSYIITGIISALFLKFSINKYIQVFSNY